MFFLLSCSATNQVTQSPAEPVSQQEPVIEQGQRDEIPAPHQPEPITAEPAVPGPTVLPPAEPREPLPSPSSPPSETPKVAPEPALAKTQVVWSSVNLREGPGVNYRVLGTVKKGTSLAILEDRGQWLHVRLEGGKEVWIFKSATLLAPKVLPSTTRPKLRPM